MKKIDQRLRNVAITQQIVKHENPGLCVNCSLQKTCVFLKTRGPVQFCEEYE